jgi:hypothetical protein
VTPLAAPTCPLCGGPNGCAPARSGTFDSPCWCTTATFDREQLARVPPALRGVACICARCAGVATSTAGVRDRA